MRRPTCLRRWAAVLQVVGPGRASHQRQVQTPSSSAGRSASRKAGRVTSWPACATTRTGRSPTCHTQPLERMVVHDVRSGSRAATEEWDRPGIVWDESSPRPYVRRDNRSGLVWASGRSQLPTLTARTSRPAVVQRAVLAPVLRRQRQLDRSLHRTVRTQEGVTQLEQPFVLVKCLCGGVRNQAKAALMSGTRPKTSAGSRPRSATGDRRQAAAQSRLSQNSLSVLSGSLTIRHLASSHIVARSVRV